MKVFFLSLLIAPAAFADSANSLNRYIGTGGSTVVQITPKESGTRFGGRLQFGVLDPGAELDFRIGSGLGYTDYGSSFRFFGHWNQGGTFQLSAGLGLGFLYSRGKSDNNVATDDSTFDPLVTPFVRVIADTGKGWGVAFETALEAVPERLKGLGDTNPTRDRVFRNRIALTISLLFNYKDNWML